MKRPASVALGLALLVLAVYLPVLNNGFINLDDGGYVYDNPQVKEGLTWNGFRWAFTTGYEANWHPLTWLSHMLDVEMFGLVPAGHHAVSAVLHSLAAALLLLGLAEMTGALWPSAFAAALFALHPLRVESVAWASERKDVLAGFFFVLTLLAYVRYVRKPSPGRYLAVAGLFMLGLLAKPMLVSLPLILLIIDWWPLARGGVGPRAWRGAAFGLVREKYPLLVMAAASAVVTFIVQHGAGAASPLERLPFPPRLTNALTAYAAYLGKMLWPARLAVFYPHPGREPRVGAAVAGGLILLLLTAAAWRLRRRAPYLTAGWFWDLISLVPVIGLVQVGAQSMADRYTYLPSMGMSLAVAWGLAVFLHRRRVCRALLFPAAATLLGTLAFLSIGQVLVWRDSETLFNHALLVTENNWVAHNNLGNALVEKGMLEEGKRHYLSALRIKPDYDTASYNLGNAFLREGKLEEAITWYRRAVTVNPDYFKAWLTLGLLESRLGEYAGAERDYGEALRVNPGDAEVRNNLGVALSAEGRYDEALDAFAAAVRARPDYADAHFNWGILLDEMGLTEESKAHFREALRINPGHRAAREALGGEDVGGGRPAP